MPRLPYFIPLLLVCLSGVQAQIVLEEVASSPAKSSLTAPAQPSTNKADPKASWRVVDSSDGTVNTTVFRLHQPISARRLRLTLFFESGEPGAVFRAFKMLATTDAAPSLDGRWEAMFPVWFGSTEGDVVRDGLGVRLKGKASGPILKVDFSLPFDAVTGLRLEVSATGPEDAPRPAILTELRLQHFNTFTTNVALGCPVITSHPLPEGMYPGFLTDGLRGTYARPPAPDLRENFYFEVDLKRHYELDHLHFSTRPDALESNRFSQVWVRLYDRKPSPTVSPRWEGLYRANGSVPDTGHEIVRPAMGKGSFSGRYLRVSSESPSPFSPQIAEVEAYEVMVPLGVTAMTQKDSWKATATLEMPANASWLTFAIDHPKLADPVGLGRRWRIAGFNDQWQVGSTSGVVESRCPPPGEYEFQAQIRHSDLQWNAAIYRVPLIIPMPFWQRPWVRVAGLLLAAGLTTLLAWQISRRVMTRRVAELERRNELSAERARIARDMHDAVGSQLTQLTMLHEIVAEELDLDTEARLKLRHLTDTARGSVAALDAVVWAVNPCNDTLANLASYITHAAREYLAPLGIACRQDVPNEWPELEVSSQARHQLYLAFREALQNVVKHARAKGVTITLRHEGGRFIASLADNGIGLPADNDGLEKDGLRNMRSRLAAVGGACTIRPRPEGGTLVEMQIPVPS